MVIPEHLLSERKVVLLLGSGESLKLNDARMYLLLIISPLITHDVYNQEYL